MQNNEIEMKQLNKIHHIFLKFELLHCSLMRFGNEIHAQIFREALLAFVGKHK